MRVISDWLRAFGLLMALMCSMLLNGISHAALDNKGTEFIFVFNPNMSVSDLELHLVSDKATSVTIHYPVISPTFTKKINVGNEEVVIVTLPQEAAQNWAANETLNNAVRVFAEEEFVAYLLNRGRFTSDAALGLPIDTMNTQYLIADYSSVNRGSQFTVYAAYDNTTVTITPAIDLVGRTAGVAFDVLLNKGEGYYARDASTEVIGKSLGKGIATEIISDRPVGVVSGHRCAQVPVGIKACDHLFEVAQPVQSWGKTALVGGLPDRPMGSIYRLVASEDATSIWWDGVVRETLNRGEYIETSVLAGDHLFSADKPISVTQFMTGINASGALLGDPAMVNITPVEQYQSSYTFSTMGDEQFKSHWITLIARHADTETITLDGESISERDLFLPITGSEYSVARINVEGGVHTTLSVEGHGLTIEGYSFADSYAYSAGASLGLINPVGDTYKPICDGYYEGDSWLGSGEDQLPSEEINAGIFFMELKPGASKLTLAVSDSFVPADKEASYTVTLSEGELSGAGTVIVTDGSGNSCKQCIKFPAPKMCDVDDDGDVDKDDLGLIFGKRNQSACGAEDPWDPDGDGVITVLDGSLCRTMCTRPNCETI